MRTLPPVRGVAVERQFAGACPLRGGSLCGPGPSRSVTVNADLIRGIGGSVADVPAVAEGALIGVEPTQVVATVVGRPRDATRYVPGRMGDLAHAGQRPEALHRRCGRRDGEHSTCPFGTRGAPVGPSRIEASSIVVSPRLSGPRSSSWPAASTGSYFIAVIVTAWRSTADFATGRPERDWAPDGLGRVSRVRIRSDSAGSPPRSRRRECRRGGPRGSGRRTERPAE